MWLDCDFISVLALLVLARFYFLVFFPQYNLYFYLLGLKNLALGRHVGSTNVLRF